MKDIIVALLVLISVCVSSYPANARTDIIQGWGRQTEDQGSDEACDMTSRGVVSDTNKADGKARTDRVLYSKDIVGGDVNDSQRTALWKYKPTPVKTPLEAQFDTNKNGVLEPEETMQMLKARIQAMEAGVKTRVESQTEAMYDLDKNGYVDLKELEQMKKDLR